MHDWRTLADQVHAIVDSQLGEPIRLIPWKVSDFSAGGPDLARPEVDVTGVLAVPGATVGEAVPRGGTFRVAESDMRVAVRWSAITGSGPRTGDRIRFIRRGWTCEITYIEPRKTDRVILHLVRA